MEEDNKLQTFTLQMQLPAPNLEVAKRVADEAQRLKISMDTITS